MKKAATSTESFLETIERNQKAYQDADEKAKEKGILLGRFLAEQIADGYAIYKIIRVNKKSVRIQVVTEIGDDWTVPYWGAETTIPLAYAEESIRRRDGLNALFSRKEKGGK